MIYIFSLDFFKFFFFCRNAGDKVKRSVNHMFHQASFYPINPPMLDMCVDSEMAIKFATLKTVPNMLIVPSDLKCCIRVCRVFVLYISVILRFFFLLGYK